MTRTRLAWLLCAPVLAYALAFISPSARSNRSQRVAASDAEARALEADRPALGASAGSVAGADVHARASRFELAADDESDHAAQPSELGSALTATRPASTAVPLEVYVQHYDRALEREPQDRDWDQQVQSDLTRLLASTELAGAHLGAQRCGTTLCRVELSYDSLAARERAEEALPLRAPFNSDGLIHADSANSLEVAVYFSRQGHPLPDPAQASML